MSFIDKNQLFLFEEIVKKNFASKYKDSVIGIFWSVLKPLLIMILLTIIFSTVFGRNIENYPVYFLSGRCIYTFFNDGVGAAMNAIKGNRNILKKTAAPKSIFVLGSIASEFINFLITLIILLFVMVVTKAPFHLDMMILAIIPVIPLLIMISGIGLLLSILAVYYSDVKHLWNVIAMMIMYASALFYPMDIIPLQYQKYMVLNPVFWIIDQFRHFMVWGSFPDALNILNLYLLSAIILVLGVIVFKKYQGKVSMKF